ncbi:MAG: bifunctional diaminohydroxyphosphoribosylaminopyrimidine deaminase/5-amino-6-(5-phosphoribosylamino)uracil reductase RibD [Chloroflexi bacterium]|nr:bifunctional diaminohydroxyphosphoribosylaminopyrimidine deaminase/5-amino-6-(5-phosphoribosylamino)uracil reductase RibD [Chloroflexota bacterium]
MRHALELARKAWGNTSPNPAVGAVLVKDGQIIGEGFTQPPGGAHAEVVALAQAGDRAKGSTLYVTLEPCCPPKLGHTPPCTEALIAAGISEVHFSLKDPNPQVNGAGKAALEAAGIKTYECECDEKCREVNEAYFKYITTGMPFVIAKFAMSLDGKLATWAGDSQWISGEQPRAFALRLRRLVDAVMVGVNTVIRDDPQLTCRENSKIVKAPLRVVVDSHGRTPPSARVFKQPGKTLLAIAHPLPPTVLKALHDAGAETLELPAREGNVDVGELLKALGKRQVTSVLVEGGGTLLGSFFDYRLVDKVYTFIAPLIIGGKDATAPVEGKGVETIEKALRLVNPRVYPIGEELLAIAYTKDLQASPK